MKISKFLLLFLVTHLFISAQDDCLVCHEDQSLTYERKGKEISLFIDGNRYSNSVHGMLDCADCHTDFDGENLPHREGTDIYKVECADCHEEIYSIVQNDVHHRLKDRVKNPPECIDCHGSHYVKPPEDSPNKARDYCSSCHETKLLMRPFHSVQKIEDNACADCHSTEDFAPQLSQSVHKDLICNDCHSAIASKLDDHPDNFNKVEVASCYVCHKEQADQHKESIHGISLSDGITEAAACWDCHGSHEVLHVNNPASKVSNENLGHTCGVCHDDAKFAEKFNLINVRSGLRFEDSFHYTLMAQGKDIDMNCSTCHGVHDIKNRIQPGSKISTFNLNETCEQCHADVVHDYKNSIHWIGAQKGLRVAPICSDCHSEHSPRAKELAEGTYSVKQFQEEICISCHQDPILTSRLGLSQTEAYSYQDSYHGLAVKRNDPNAAYCIDCHNVHDILPQKHPASSVSEEKVLQTCQKCHPDAKPVFAKSYSHISQNKEAQQVEDLVSTIYFWLIVVIIGGMILHNLLIYVHEVRKRKQNERKEILIPRFTRNEVIQHVLLFTSFFTLAITGFALKYPFSWWADGLYQFGMSEDIRQLIHRIAAVVMIVLSLYHVIYLVITKRGRDVLSHMAPKFEDIKEATQNLMYYLRLRKHPPEFSKFDYTEKAEYWALVWGTIVMGVTGLILWFPTIVDDWAPVWLIKVSETIHFYEAILATLAIFVWHWFFVIFRPSEYPMSFVWVDGKMSLHRYRHHHERHFKKIALEWMQVKEEQKNIDEVSHSTKLFLDTMKKHGVNPDEIMSAEMENDPELRNWVIERLKGL
ncbi:MAG: DUF4405 domain-containing protein [Ignavibacteriales bacterium]|nr:MAG: DUF4405 domain-containing protein [Ignavibacteriales bacterium]